MVGGSHKMISHHDRWVTTRNITPLIDTTQHKETKIVRKFIVSPSIIDTFEYKKLRETYNLQMTYNFLNNLISLYTINRIPSVRMVCKNVNPPLALRILLRIRESKTSSSDRRPPAYTSSGQRALMISVYVQSTPR